MQLTDTIGDLLTRIRNSIAVKQEQVLIPYSKMKFNIIKILKEEGFIRSYEIVNEGVNKKFILINLKYDNEGISVISSLKRVSKPSKRIYLKKMNIGKVINGFGINVFSTTRGIMTGKQARIAGIGGELICEIY